MGFRLVPILMTFSDLERP